MAKEKRFSPEKSNLLLLGLMLLGSFLAAAQDRIKIESNVSAERPRIAVSDFKAANTDAQTGPLNAVFNQALWNDLSCNRSFEIVAKKFYPAQTPGQPEELNARLWGAPPTNATLLVFGSVGVSKGKISIRGWGFSLKNPPAPEVLSSHYEQDATAEKARLIAQLFADEILALLGSGSKDDWYLDLVRRQVQQNWPAYDIDPQIKTPPRVCVEFDITRDGAPWNVHVVQSSGVPALDRSAMRAIQRIDSFPQLPKGEKITVDFWFEYSPK